YSHQGPTRAGARCGAGKLREPAAWKGCATSRTLSSRCVFSALRTRHVWGESAGLAVAAAFGVRQLVGAFARGTGGIRSKLACARERQRRQVAAFQTLARLRNIRVCADARSVRRAKHVP